jgi:hypothetical protein
MTSGYYEDNLCDRLVGALSDDRGLSDVAPDRPRVLQPALPVGRSSGGHRVTPDHEDVDRQPGRGNT